MWHAVVPRWATSALQVGCLRVLMQSKNSRIWLAGFSSAPRCRGEWDPNTDGGSPSSPRLSSAEIQPSDPSKRIVTKPPGGIPWIILIFIIVIVVVILAVVMMMKKGGEEPAEPASHEEPYEPEGPGQPEESDTFDEPPAPPPEAPPE